MSIISLACLFKLLYCSPVWRPQRIKDIRDIASVQRRATKFILADYSSDYKLRLTRLNLLPLMMELEVNDIMFFVTNLKDPSQSLNVKDYVQFCSAGTRASTFLKLKQQMFKLKCVKRFTSTAYLVYGILYLLWT